MVDGTTRRSAYVGKARAEIDALSRRGAMVAGNAFSPVLLAKGELANGEGVGSPLLAGDDGRALRAALTALGYAPEEWCGLATARADGSPLDAETVRLAVSTLDPSTLIACDDRAAAALREAFADDLATLTSLEAALLTPGFVVPVAGMRVLNLGGFASALSSPGEKQRMWAWLKQIPPLGEPF